MNVSRKSPLHLSTLLIVAGTAFALLLIVIPGEIDDRYYARDFQQQSYGWPWVHLHRFVPKQIQKGRDASNSNYAWNRIASMVILYL